METNENIVLYIKKTDDVYHRVEQQVNEINISHKEYKSLLKYFGTDKRNKFNRNIKSFKNYLLVKEKMTFQEIFDKYNSN